MGRPAPPAGQRRSIDHRPYKRAEDHFSARFGVEVRHIGQWDGVEKRNVTEVWKRDDQEGLIPTFGVRYRDSDLHFAYHGKTLEGHKRVKIGFGPGPETEQNTRRLKARGELEDEIHRIKLSFQYNRYYFDSGGLDMVVEANSDNGHASEIELPQIPGLFVGNEDYIPAAGENENFGLMEQVACNLGLGNPNVSLTDEDHPVELDSIGLWFQIIDKEYRGTIASGAISPFTIDDDSIIRFMKPEGGIELNERCSPAHFN